MLIFNDLDNSSYKRKPLAKPGKNYSGFYVTVTDLLEL